MLGIKKNMRCNKQNGNFVLVEDKIIKNHKRKFTLTNKNTPIDIWWDLIHSDNDHVKIKQILKQVYESNLPTLGEIIFTSKCQFNCQHCIYPVDYSRFNTCLSLDQWKRIIKNIYDDLKIKTFIHCGRSMDDTGITVLEWMRQSFENIQIGLIDNGVSLIPYLDKLSVIQPDWIDISIDGLEREHDFQRNQVGSFKKALSTISYLELEDIAPKINTLICLTSLNKDSVIDLIAVMNKKGFKNFFISPVITFKDFGPSEKLKVLGDDLVYFIQNMYSSLHKFKDTWIEVNLFYEIEYLKYIKTFYSKLWHRFEFEQKHISCKMYRADNEFYINYYPLSLDGIRELTINSNGDVIFPQVMRKGQISDKDIIGNLLQQSASEIIKRLRSFKLEFYVNALLIEKELYWR